LRREAEALERLGVQVLVVTFEPEAAARAYLAETALPWPLLVDASRGLYRAYAMGRGRVRDVWSWATIRTYLRLLRQGARLRPPAADPYQLGGDVLIDPAGRVRLHHVGTGPADRPSVASLLAAARGT
jgi:hypothetical protein